jgi:microcystin-dependent protein
MAWPNPPATWTTGQVVTATDLNTELRDALISVLPIATLILRCAAYTTTETAVEGRWLQCNGAAVSRTTYAALFAYLNSLSPALPFGTGDGSTTFNLPDLRGRGAWAEGEHTTVDVMGDSDGVAVANRSPNHRHTVEYGGSGSDSTILGDVGPGSITAGEIATKSAATTGTPVDSPAYLVVGSYFIKYN